MNELMLEYALFRLKHDSLDINESDSMILYAELAINYHLGFDKKDVD